jgi:8-oxo-dGTP diphosphatase
MVPRIGVGVIVLDGPRVLLIKRGKPPRLGQWSIPGGHLELGEGVLDCGVREVREETGLHVQIHGLVDVLDLIERGTDGAVQRHICLIDYWATPIGGTLCAGDDALDAAWSDIHRIDAMGLWQQTQDVIHKAAQMRDA